MKKENLTNEQLQRIRFARIRAEICYYLNITEDEFEFNKMEFGFRLIEYLLHGDTIEGIRLLRESYIEDSLFWGAYTSKYYYVAESFLVHAIKNTRGRKSYPINEFMSLYFYKYINNVQVFDIDSIFLSEAVKKFGERRKIYEANRK